MRHKKHSHQLGVKSAHRTALVANLSAALLTHGRIRTTLAKAKALRPFIERVITLAKKGKAASTPEEKLHFYRQALSRVRNRDAVTLLFDERVDEFVNRDGGYTRIYKLGARLGDAAPMALIELVPGDDQGYAKRRRSTKGSKKAAEAVADDGAGESAVADEVATEEASADEVAAEGEPEETEKA